MADYRRVCDSRHPQADCQEPESAPEPYARQSSMDYLFSHAYFTRCKNNVRAVWGPLRLGGPGPRARWKGQPCSNRTGSVGVKPSATGRRAAASRHVARPQIRRRPALQPQQPASLTRPHQSHLPRPVRRAAAAACWWAARCCRSRPPYPPLTSRRRTSRWTFASRPTCCRPSTSAPAATRAAPAVTPATA